MLIVLSAIPVDISIPNIASSLERDWRYFFNLLIRTYFCALVSRVGSELLDEMIVSICSESVRLDEQSTH